MKTITSISHSLSEVSKKHTLGYTMAVSAVTMALTLLLTECYEMEVLGMDDYKDTIWRVRDIDREYESEQIPIWWEYQCGMVDGIEGWVTKLNFDSYDEAREFIEAAYHDQRVPQQVEIVELEINGKIDPNI